MATPLPNPGAARLGPPDRAEAQACLDAALGREYDSYGARP